MKTVVPRYWAMAASVLITSSLLCSHPPAVAQEPLKPSKAPANQAVTRLVSKGPNGTGAEGETAGSGSIIAGNCKSVAFATSADLLLADDDGQSHVYLRNRAQHRVQLIDQAANGLPAEDSSSAEGISRTGQYIAYISSASNVVPGDTGSTFDVFLRDTTKARSELVSVAEGGGPATGQSFSASVSASGRLVAFSSTAADIVPNDTNGTSDIFVRDRASGTTQRVSVAPGGAQSSGASVNAEISGNGRFVLFESDAGDLVPGVTNAASNVFRYDRAAHRTTLVSANVDGDGAAQGARAASVSNNGRFVAFASLSADLVQGDTNDGFDVFVRDIASETTIRASVGSAGTQAGGDQPDLSGDGQVVAFRSKLSDVVPHDTNDTSDVFIHRLATGVTRRISVSTSGAEAEGSSVLPSINDTGKCITFDSEANNLARRDTNPYSDIFLRRLAHQN